jgi:hypothetical protein
MPATWCQYLHPLGHPHGDARYRWWSIHGTQSLLPRSRSGQRCRGRDGCRLAADGLEDVVGASVEDDSLGGRKESGVGKAGEEEDEQSGGGECAVVRRDGDGYPVCCAEEEEEVLQRVRGGWGLDGGHEGDPEAM